MMRSVCAISLSLLAISFSASAQAAKVTETYALKNRGASAAFFGADETTAVALSVYYSEIAETFNGEPVVSPPSTFIELSYQDTAGHFFSLSGSTDQAQATFTGDHSSATLYAVVPVSGINVNTEEPVSTTVTLSLTFTATGPFTRFKQKDATNEGGVKFKFSATSDGRPAQATGAATFDLFGDDRPLIFAPSLDGAINKNLMGSVTKIKP